VDANGILQVSALDKNSGSATKITISNDKGRLSLEEIDRKVREAEKYRNQDDKHRAQHNARNALEALAFAVKNKLNDGRVMSPQLETICERLDKNAALARREHSGHGRRA